MPQFFNNQGDFAAERENQAQEVQNLGQQIEWTQARIDVLQEEHGSNLESETELNRLKLLKKNYKDDLEKKKKELAALEKKSKAKEKIQAKGWQRKEKTNRNGKRKKHNRRKA